MDLLLIIIILILGIIPIIIYTRHLSFVYKMVMTKKMLQQMGIEMPEKVSITKLKEFIDKEEDDIDEDNVAYGDMYQ